MIIIHVFEKFDDDQRLERRRRLQQFIEKGIEEEHYSSQEVDALENEKPDWTAELPPPPITIEAKRIRATRSQTVMIYQ